MAAPVIGLRINNYEIVSLLGEGGMGAVYLAVHPVMGRKVAIKLLRRELAEDKSLVARFINEARAANAIRHPNIIDVIDVGTLQGQGEAGLPYMVMEFLEGVSLAKRLEERGRLDTAEAVEIANQTASALGAAHAKGIVHRDLKPDNLFLVPDEMNPGRERVKVLDFGIAKLRGEIGSGSVKTNAGSIMGTPPYMSPEQCRGIVEEVDHRTDVYALGIILFEMLCGGPPFASAGYGEVLVMHLTQPPPSPRTRNPEIPEVLEQAILKALAKNRDQRFGSMSELQQALGRIPTAVGPRRAFDRAVAASPMETAATMAHTPVPPPGSGHALTPKSTTFTATTGTVAAVEEAVASRPRKSAARAILATLGVAGLVAVGALTARSFLQPAVSTPVMHSGGAPAESRPMPTLPPRAIVVPPPAPIPTPPPAQPAPVVAAPRVEKPAPAEPVRRPSKRVAARRTRSAPAEEPASGHAPPPPPPPVQPTAAPPPPPAKKPAEKW